MNFFSQILSAICYLLVKKLNLFKNLLTPLIPPLSLNNNSFRFLSMGYVHTFAVPGSCLRGVYQGYTTLIKGGNKGVNTLPPPPQHILDHLANQSAHSGQIRSRELDSSVVDEMQHRTYQSMQNSFKVCRKISSLFFKAVIEATNQSANQEQREKSSPVDEMHAAQNTLVDKKQLFSNLTKNHNYRSF